MEISPNRPSNLTTTNSRSKNTNAREGSGGGKDPARAAEKEARQRIEQLDQSVKTAQAHAQEKIDYLQEDYSRQTAEENARLEKAMIDQQTKGYEALRQMQRQQQAELARVRRQGENELAALKEYYQHSIFNTETHGKEQLTDIQNRNNLEFTNLEQDGKNRHAELRAQQEFQTKRLHEDSQSKFQALAESSRTEFERMRANSALTTEDSQKKQQDALERVLQQQRVQTEDIQRSTGEKLSELRKDNSRKLAAYTERNRDPFYQMMDIGARLTDQGDYYEVTASIPEHEQKHVSVNVRGNQLVISGHRRTDEKVELEPGRTRGTAAYQSFHETFTLDLPVDGRELKRQFEGNQLLVRVPKAGNKYVSRVAEKKPGDKSRLEMPKFPDNMPSASKEISKSPDDEAPTGKVSTKTTGSRPLS